MPEQLGTQLPNLKSATALATKQNKRITERLRVLSQFSAQKITNGCKYFPKLDGSNYSIGGGEFQNHSFSRKR